jgi:hypothetical protein
VGFMVPHRRPLDDCWKARQVDKELSQAASRNPRVL